MKSTKLARMRKELEAIAQTYRKPRRPWTPEEIEFAVDFWGRVPHNILCEKLGRSTAAIRSVVWAERLKRNEAKQ